DCHGLGEIDPRPSGPDGRQIGTKEDARAALAYLQDLSTAVKKAADEHKCLAEAMRDINLPKYEEWANYDAYLPMNSARFCDFEFEDNSCRINFCKAGTGRFRASESVAGRTQFNRNFCQGVQGHATARRPSHFHHGSR